MFKKLSIYQAIISFCIIFITQNAQAATDKWQMNLFKGVTPLSQEIYNLHMIAMLICAVIGVIVFGIMFYSLLYHRKSRGYQPATFHDNNRLEMVWSIIPLLILIGLAIPATSVLIKMDNSNHSDLTIKIVGSQWKWQYQYFDQGISYFSSSSTPYAQTQNKQAKGEWYLLEVDKPLVLPINKKIRFLVTSSDVVHSWWVPELGVKRDAIPGFMHEAWAIITKPGIYRGQCAELCGINHGFMPIVVNAVSEEAFNKWVASQPKVLDGMAANTQPVSPNLTRQELIKRGKEKYNEACLACHKADGTGLPPLFPALKGSSIAVGKPISRHIELILNGVPGTAMQAYRDQLNDEDIAAIATYERNAWDNNTGDEIQPQDVANVRKEQMKQPTIVKKAQAGGFR